MVKCDDCDDDAVVAYRIRKKDKVTKEGFACKEHAPEPT